MHEGLANRSKAKFRIIASTFKGFCRKIKNAKIRSGIKFCQCS